jgi:hypothetical protein
MGPVASSGGEEEAENLRAIDMLLNVLASFAKQPCYEKGYQRESVEGSLKAF